jgi:general secretion pathway protein D
VLIVTDTASNIRRLLDIIKLVDVEVALEEVQIIQLQYADASEVAQILTQLFASGRIRPAAAAAPPAAPPAPPAPPQPGAPPAAPPPAVRGGTEAPPEHPPMILPERRTNSLVVHARRNELETIRNLIGRLDVNISGGRRVFIYYAENAKAKDLATTMNAIYNREGAAQPTNGASPPAAQAVPLPITPTSLAPVGPAAAQTGFVEGQFRFIADEATNAVILATYPRLWTEIEQTLKELDRSPRQVLIEVLVAEVTLEDETRLGMNWIIKSGDFTAISAPGLGNNPAGTITPPLVPDVVPISSLAGLTAFAFATDKFFAALNAFAAENKVNVLSNPSILTSENKKAVINVSQSIPIVTSQQVPFGGTVNQPTQQSTAAIVGTQTVEYKDAGVILTVTPRIGEQGTVALDVKQEVNDVGPRDSVTGSPTILKREAETSVVLLNNQTLVLGGLIRDRQENVDRGIPWFKDIPVLGVLFAAKRDLSQKTELLMVITPRVIGTALDAAKITDALRRANPQAERSIQRAPALPPTSPGLAPPARREPGVPAPAPLPPAAPPSGPAPGGTPSRSPGAMRQDGDASPAAAASAPGTGPSAHGSPTAAPPAGSAGAAEGPAPPDATRGDGHQIDSAPAAR